MIAVLLALLQEVGTVKGKVTIGIPGVGTGDVGPIVLYLEAEKAFEPPKEIAKISQKDAKFSPDFLVVAAGQTVDMPNDDKIVHNVFSFSKPNDFDLGLYPKGERKVVVLKHPGVVDLYCSIHSKMNATVFVAPTPFHAVADAEGRFELKGVPAGTYKLKSWNRKLPAAAKALSVEAGKDVEGNLEIQEKK